MDETKSQYPKPDPKGFLTRRTNGKDEKDD